MPPTHDHRAVKENGLQDLEDCPSRAFSKSRLLKYGEWRRLYLPLYQEKMEADSRRQAAPPELRSKLEAAETELPVDAIMLLRSVAEDEHSRRGAQQAVRRQWMTWGLTSLFGIFHSPSEMDPLVLAAPNDEDIKGVYSDLQAEDTETATPKLSASIELKIDSWSFRISDAASDIVEFTGGQVQVEMNIARDGSTCRAMMADMTGVDKTVADGRLMVSFARRPAVIVKLSDSGVEVTANGISLSPRPGLFKRCATLQHQLPQWTLGRWMQVSNITLPTKRSRVLSQLTPPLHLPSITLRFFSPRLLLHSSDGTTSLVFRAASGEAVWKLQEREFSLRSLSEMPEDAFVREVLDPFVYARWAIALQNAVVQLQDDDTEVGLLDPFSATGNLSINTSVLEASLPFLVCDWRFTPIALSITPDVFHSLLFLASDLETEAALPVMQKANLAALSSDGMDSVKLLMRIAAGGVSIDLCDVFSSSVDLNAIDRSVEISVSYPRLKIAFDGVVDEKEGIVTSITFASQTGAIRVTQCGQCLHSDCSLQLLHLQDISNDGHDGPPIRHMIPRLGRSVSARECSIAFALENGSIHGRGSLSGVEGNGYLGESGGQIHSNGDTNTVSFSLDLAIGRGALGIELDHAALGSTFLVRFLGFLLPPPKASAAGDASSRGVCKVDSVSVFQLSVSESFLSFPRVIAANEKESSPALFLNMPNVKLKTADTQMVSEDGHPVCSVMEIEQFLVQNGRLLVPLPQGDTLLSVLHISEMHLDHSAETLLSAIQHMTECSARDVRYRFSVGSIEGCFDEHCLESVTTSLTLFQHQMQRTFPQPKHDSPSTDTVLHSFALNTDITLDVEKLQFVLKESKYARGLPFCLSLMQLHLHQDTTPRSHSGSLYWNEAHIVAVREVPDAEAFVLKNEGLLPGCALPGSSEALASKDDSLEEDESGSVSSSTSWQTAGSNVSASRRAGPSQPFTSEFESVHESMPYLMTGADRGLSPFPESASDEPSSPRPEVEEETTEEDSELDLMLAKITAPPGRCIQWDINHERGIDLDVASLEVAVNLTHLGEFVQRLQGHVESVKHTHLSSHQERRPEFSIRAKIDGISVIIDAVPLLSTGSLSNEPPRLQTAFCLGPAYGEVSHACCCVRTERMELQSSWVRCTDPRMLQMVTVRKLGPVLYLQHLVAQLQLSKQAERPGPRNPASVALEIENVSVDLSLQKMAPLFQLSQSLLQLRPLQASPSGAPAEGSTAAPAVSTSGGIERFLFRQHLMASLCIPSITILIEDDSQQSIFPFLHLRLQDVNGALDSLRQSGAAALDLRATIELQTYNRQRLGWEHLLESASVRATAKANLPAINPSASKKVAITSLEVSFTTPVEISITPGMIRTAVQLLKTSKSLSAVQARCKEMPRVHYWIDNHTGSDIECYPYRRPLPEPFLIVKPRQSHPITESNEDQMDQHSDDSPVLTMEGLEEKELQEYESSMRASLLQVDRQLAFRLTDQLLPCGPLSPISPGTFRFAIECNSFLFPSTRDVSDPVDRLFNRSVSKRTTLACDVHVRSDGAMQVDLRSDFLIKNETAYRIEVGCWTGEEIRHQVTFVEPSDTFWIPIMTVAHGRFMIRPQPTTADRYPLRCAWSQSVSLGNIPKGQSRTQVCCDAISGGLKSVWLLVGVDHRSPDDTTVISIQAPVIVHNFLPVPLSVAASCDDGKTTALKGKLAPRSSMQGYTIHGGDITTLRLVPTGYSTTDIAIDLSAADDPPLSEFEPSVEDVTGAEVEIQISVGLVPIRLKHRVEGFTGRHVFEICCALWIHNCTTVRFAVRTMHWSGVTDQEILMDEEDVVPDRWVLPIAPSAPIGSTSTRSTPSGSPSALGLQSLLLQGEPASFRLRSDAPVPPDEHRARRAPRGSPHPSMEIRGSPKHGASRLQFRTSGSQAPVGRHYWSETAFLGGSGAAVVRCQHPMHATSTSPAFPKAVHYFAVTQVSIPHCGGTTALHVMPRYVLNNSTASHFQYRQQGIRLEKVLMVDDTQSIHWPDDSKPLLLSIRVQEAGWMWSGGLKIDAPGDTMIKLRHRVREETLLIQMDVGLRANGVLYATLMHQPSGFAPYRLDNFTSDKIYARQCGSGNQEDILRPYSSMPYAWDQPTGMHKVILEGPGRTFIGQFELDRVGTDSRTVLFPETSDSYSSRLRRIKIAIRAEGPTRVLALLDEDVHPDLPRRTPSFGSSERNRPPFLSVHKPGIACALHLPAVGISVVSDVREMAYVRMAGLSVTASWDDVWCGFAGTLGHFQIDGCMRHVTYPVLARGPVANESWTGVMGVHPSRKALDMSTSVWRERPGGVVCLESFTLFLAPFSLNIEERVLRPWLQFLQEWIPQHTTEKNFRPDFTLSECRLPTGNARTLKVYLEDLSISRCIVDFSFCPSESRPPVEGHRFWQRIVSLANFEGARICLSPLKLKHPLLSVPAMTALIARHYTNCLLQEIYKVVGSADILGDPVHLVQRMGLGVWLLFANPAYAFVRSRSLNVGRLLMACMTGVTSLMSNVVFGFGSATSKISLAARRGLLLFFQLDSRSPSSSDLLRSVLEGAVGVLSGAAQGLDEGGVVGFSRGLLSGMLRLCTQPLALVLEMISDLSESVSQSLSGMMTHAQLFRMTRHVGPGQPLEPYDRLLCLGSVILKEIWNGALKGEKLQGCFLSCDADVYLIVTQKFLLRVRWKAPKNPVAVPVLMLAVALEDVECIRRSGLSVNVFGFVPLKCWKSRTLLTEVSRSPFFSESVQCADIATSCRLSMMLKIACQKTPRRTVKWGNGYCISHV